MFSLNSKMNYIIFEKDSCLFQFNHDRFKAFFLTDNHRFLTAMIGGFRELTFIAGAGPFSRNFGFIRCFMIIRWESQHSVDQI